MKSQKLSKSIDLNSDNYLNRHEFQRWYNPNIDQLVNEQKVLVYNFCDNDYDGFLNKTEILNNCKELLKSQVTNFGLDFFSKTSKTNIEKVEL